MNLALPAMLFAVVVSASPPAVAALSEKDFAKCQALLEENSAKHRERADKARAEHREFVSNAINDFASDVDDSGAASERMSGIISRLAERYELERYYDAYVDDVITTATGVENTEKFRCPSKQTVNYRFRANLERYTGRIEQIEEAIEERIDLEDLDDDEGLVVISFFAHGYAEDIRINRLGGIGGGIKFGPVSNNEYFRVLKVKAGEYKWNTIRNTTWWGRIVLFVKRQDLIFRVEPGKLNYTGLFIYRSQSHRGRPAAVHDRAAVVLEILEQRYPELLDHFDVVDGINDNSNFINFYLGERAAAAEAGDDA